MYSKSKCYALVTAAIMAWFGLPGLLSAEQLLIEGTKLAAIEMPQTTVLLRKPQTGVDPPQIIPINLPIEDPFSGEIRNEYAFTAFLDTGTSGTLISKEFFDLFNTGITRIEKQQTSGGTPVSFFDVAIEGETEFHTTEPLYVSIAPSPLVSEPEYNDLPGINATFTAPQAQPIRMQVGLTEAGFLEEPRNIIGMTLLKDRVMVTDARAYTHFDPDGEDSPYLATSVLNHGDAGVPTGGRTVHLSYGDFSAFTRISPTTPDDPLIDPPLEKPALAANPFVGANPLDPQPDAPRGVTIARAQGDQPEVLLSSTGNWLLDTGAQLTFMSSLQAEALHIVEDVDGTGKPILIDTDTRLQLTGQFSVDVGGAGGGGASFLGFILDHLTVPADEGDIIYKDLPILILDVGLHNPLTGDDILLDGVLGMNLFLPNRDLDLSMTLGAFDYMIFDEQTGQLQLIATVPEPASFVVFVMLAAPLLARRRRRRADSASVILAA